MCMRVCTSVRTDTPLHLIPSHGKPRGPLRQVAGFRFWGRFSGTVAEDGSSCPVCSLTTVTEPQAPSQGRLLGGGDGTGDVDSGGKVVEGRQQTSPYQEDRGTKEFTECSENGQQRQ